MGEINKFTSPHKTEYSLHDKCSIAAYPYFTHLRMVTNKLSILKESNIFILK